MKLCAYYECLDEVEEVKFDIGLCRTHSKYFYVKMKEFFFSSKLAIMYNKGELKAHSSGITYFMEVCPGVIKIGFSRDHNTLYKRMQAFRLEFKSHPILLATLTGGETLEAIYHNKFRHLRIHDFGGELFKKSPDLISEIDSIGFEANGILANQKYEEFKARLG